MDIKSYFNNPLFADFTFKYKDESYPAHKMVLGQSPYFKTFFTTSIGGDKNSCVIEYKEIYTYCVALMYGIKPILDGMSPEGFIEAYETMFYWEVPLQAVDTEVYVDNNFEEICKIDWTFIWNRQRQFSDDLDAFLEKNVHLTDKSIFEHQFYTNKYPDEKMSFSLKLKLCIHHKELNRALDFLEDNVLNLCDILVDSCTVTPFQKSRIYRCVGNIYIKKSIRIMDEHIMVVKSLEPFKALYFEQKGILNVQNGDITFVAFKDTNKDEKLVIFLDGINSYDVTLSDIDENIYAMLEYKVGDVSCSLVDGEGYQIYSRVEI
jgi:hypothetical protein